MTDIARLKAALDGIRIEDNPAIVKQKSRDFFWYSPVLKRELDHVTGDLVVSPKDEAEVIRVLKACYELGVPVTPRGAGTGNYGQAMPLSGGVVLSLADFNALKAGVLSVRPDATVTAAFAGSFQDPAKGQEIATQMYNDGIDYIQTDAAATDGGIIAAANEKEGRMVSCLAPAQYALGPKSVIAIVGLDFGVSLYNEVSKAVGPEWKGGMHEHTGLGTGVIDFIPSPVFVEQGPADLVAKAKEAAAEVDKVRAGILDGSVQVPFNTAL